MKILFISVMRNLIPLRGPILAELGRAGHFVTVCGENNDPETVQELRKMGIHFIPYFLKQHGMNPIMDCFTFLNLVWIIRKNNPDIIFSASIKPAIYGSLASRLTGAQQVFSLISGSGYAFMRTTLKNKLVNVLACALYRLGLPINRSIFFQNPDDLSLFVDLKLVRKDQAVLINGSGVDLEQYRPVPMVKNGIVFLLISRLIKDKGIVEYVEAARVLKRRYPETTFSLLGPFDSHNPSALSKSQIEKWQQEGVIKYCGETKDVRPFISASSVYVLPSYYREGTPRSALEAMAMGRPIITTDAPGCRETVINGKNGFLVPKKDVNALVESMERLILNPDLIREMGEFSRKYAVKKFDAKKVNAILLEKMGLFPGG